MKTRKAAVAAMLALSLVAACGDEEPTGDVETGTGGNVPTTADDMYN